MFNLGGGGGRWGGGGSALPITKMVPYRRLTSLGVTSALPLSHDQEPPSATDPGRGQSWPFSRLSRPAAAAPPLLCPGASVRSANGLCERSPERPGAGGRRPSPGTLQRAQGECCSVPKRGSGPSAAAVTPASRAERSGPDLGLWSGSFPAMIRVQLLHPLYFSILFCRTKVGFYWGRGGGTY